MYDDLSIDKSNTVFMPSETQQESVYWNNSTPNPDDFSTINSSVVCSNEYCVSDEDYIEMIEAYIFPSASEWFLIACHTLVFVVGLIGNALVCVSVYRNHSMRTVTNYFIVNLAVADFLVILVCLPPSVLWDVTETWFFGSLMCKLVLYLQSVSVSVSVLTLSFISVDRWYAICHPLQFKSTASRAKKAIALIWLVALGLGLPDVLFLDIRPGPVPMYLTDCAYTWPEFYTRWHQLLVVFFLYFCPFLLMSFFYYQIVKVLWNRDNIPGSGETLHSRQIRTAVVRSNDNGAVSLTCNATTSSPSSSGGGGSSGGVEGQIRSRRKAAKMIIAVVVLFLLCYFPVHLINTLRYTTGLPQTQLNTVMSLASHWLCYANSALNPIIYNFMNGKFRREFRRSFCCLCNPEVDTQTPTQTQTMRLV
ncbi:orexin receptor type 2-like [Uloborus diversus]|uniref:orexin receptor type 2-like n=1 Tax=Uloborus diversus TaxID=327109 RepID=UPI002409708A|nr:orexin receptor type 2-like [Uloborus diversus]